MKSLYLKALAFLAQKLFGRTLEGYKTSIIGLVGFSTGLLEIFSDGILYNFLCTYVSFFCNFTSSQFHVGLLTFFAFLTQLAGSKNSLNKLLESKLEELN